MVEDWRRIVDVIVEWCGDIVHRPAEMDDDGWCPGDYVIDIKSAHGRGLDSSLGGS